MQSLRSLCSSRTAAEKTIEALRLLRESPEYQAWFTRLAMYFWFRYLLDGVQQAYEEDMTDLNIAPGFRMLARSLRTLELMCVARIRETCGSAWPETLSSVFRVEDMMDVAHIFSKEVEHDAENLEILQWY